MALVMFKNIPDFRSLALSKLLWWHTFLLGKIILVMSLLRTSFGLIKLATKAGLAGGAIYYSNKFGIWGNTQETEVGYANLKSTIKVGNLILYSYAINKAQFY